MKTVDIEPGTLVDLERTWGSVTRLKCPVCTKFIPNRAGTLSCTCGTLYEPQGSRYKVVSA